MPPNCISSQTPSCSVAQQSLRSEPSGQSKGTSQKAVVLEQADAAVVGVGAVVAHAAGLHLLTDAVLQGGAAVVDVGVRGAELGGAAHEVTLEGAVGAVEEVGVGGTLAAEVELLAIAVLQGGAAVEGVAAEVAEDALVALEVELEGAGAVAGGEALVEDAGGLAVAEAVVAVAIDLARGTGGAAGGGGAVGGVGAAGVDGGGAGGGVGVAGAGGAVGRGRGPVLVEVSVDGPALELELVVGSLVVVGVSSVVVAASWDCWWWIDRRCSCRWCSRSRRSCRCRRRRRGGRRGGRG
jgi:hypothetical protein